MYFSVPNHSLTFDRLRYGYKFKLGPKGLHTARLPRGSAPLAPSLLHCGWGAEKTGSLPLPTRSLVSLAFVARPRCPSQPPSSLRPPASNSSRCTSLLELAEIQPTVVEVTEIQPTTAEVDEIAEIEAYEPEATKPCLPLPLAGWDHVAEPTNSYRLK